MWRGRVILQLYKSSKILKISMKMGGWNFWNCIDHCCPFFRKFFSRFSLIFRFFHSILSIHKWTCEIRFHKIAWFWSSRVAKTWRHKNTHMYVYISKNLIVCICLSKTLGMIWMKYSIEMKISNKEDFNLEISWTCSIEQ